MLMVSSIQDSVPFSFSFVRYQTPLAICFMFFHLRQQSVGWLHLTVDLSGLPVVMQKTRLSLLIAAAVVVSNHVDIIYM